MQRRDLVELDHDLVNALDDIVGRCNAVLAEYPAGIQAGALAELLAFHFVAHVAPGTAKRELADHVKAVRALIPFFEDLLQQQAH